MPPPQKQAPSVPSAVNELLAAVASLLGSVGGALKDDPEVRSSAARVGKSAKKVTVAASVKVAKLRKAWRARWGKGKGKSRKARS